MSAHERSPGRDSRTARAPATSTQVGPDAVGVVKWFSSARGYGFLRTEDDKEVFVHYSEIDIPGYRHLSHGQLVSFELARGPKGLYAKAIRAALPHAPE